MLMEEEINYQTQTALDWNKKVRLETIVSDGFRISCFHSISDMRFILITAPHITHEENI